MLRHFFTRLKSSSEYLNYGREHIIAMTQNAARAWPSDVPARVLDIGLGGGTDLVNIKNALAPRPVELFGIDSYAPSVAQAAANGIRAWHANIERDPFPFDDGGLDIVLANQIIEHTKDIFWIFSEISRVLRPGGALIVGVPNLASLHNRLLLLLGEHPTTIELLGPHIRGLTRNAFARFITADGYFRLVAVRGSNFYPFPPTLAKPLGALFPTLAVSLFFHCERTDKPGRFIEVLKTRSYETNYYTGPE